MRPSPLLACFRAILKPAGYQFPKRTRAFSIYRSTQYATVSMATLASGPITSNSQSVILSATDTKGVFSNPFEPLSEATTRLTSDFLTRNHSAFHIYFNQQGFHNHIVHHLLSLYALNASPSQIQHGWDDNSSYQRPLNAFDADIVGQMQANKQNLTKFLTGDDGCISSAKQEGSGAGPHYADFLEFFSRAIEKLGVKGVLDEYVFKGDEIANKIFGRLFAGFLHPLIHLGFALEFHQPAIVAESLAQAAIHDNWLAPLINAAEKASESLKARGIESKSLTELLTQAYKNKKLRESAHYDDANKLRDGVLARAAEELIEIASQWFVPSGSGREVVDEKVAEHIHASILFTTAGAIHTSTKNGQKTLHHPKFDFFYIHDSNASIFYSAFAKDDYIKNLLGKDAIVRLLQVKGWIDIGMYISRGSPDITNEKLERIKNYQTKIEADRNTGWARIFERTCNLQDDDGHCVKFIRALANAERECQKYEDRPWCVIKGDMWEKIGWMAIDSFETKPNFIRNAGWDEAWKDIPEWKEAGVHL